jgi:hypothetical protein
VLYGYVDAFVDFMGNVYMAMDWIDAVNIGFLYPAGLYKWCRIQLGIGMLDRLSSLGSFILNWNSFFFLCDIRSGVTNGVGQRRLLTYKSRDLTTLACWEILGEKKPLHRTLEKEVRIGMIFIIYVDCR